MNHRLAMLLFTTLPVAAMATDRLVNVGGTGSVYPTITAALNAAVDGDRILVVPGIYDELLSISKSVQIVPMMAGQRYTVTGSMWLALSAQPKNIAVVGMNLQGGLFANTNTGGHRCVVQGSVLGSVEGSQSTRCRVTLISDSVLGPVSLGAGDVVGCYIKGGPYNTSVDYVCLSMGASISISNAINEPSYIIGNVIGNNEEALASNNLSTLVHVNANSPAVFENNWIRLYRSAYTSPPVVITGNTGTVGSYFLGRNNTFQWITTSTTPTILIQEPGSDPTDFPCELRNNFLVGPVMIETQRPGATVAYNVQSNDQGQVNAFTGAPVPGSLAIDSGDPNNAYADLDLSRNDSGCYGGSFSRDQFDDPLPNTAIVAWVIAQRRVLATSTVSVRAHAIDR